VPLITSDLKHRLHEYLGGIVKGLGCLPIEINGMAEHVHLLVKIRATISVSDFLSRLKSSSSNWAKRQTLGRFAWQAKYGAFTVSESQAGLVRQYISDQENHHRKISFQEEFEALLRGNRIDFDKQYL
jgi:REP element-mobilizing transposase RayT